MREEKQVRATALGKLSIFLYYFTPSPENQCVSVNSSFISNVFKKECHPPAVIAEDGNSILLLVSDAFTGFYG